MMKYKFRGNEIEFDGEDWVYSDDKTLVHENWKDKPCGHCGEGFTKEGHDACLGTLPDVMNACCGHGNDSEAYVQDLNGNVTKGLCLLPKRGI